MALLYLKQAEWNLDDAVIAYKDDEEWERTHPIEATIKARRGKDAKNVGMRRYVGHER